MNISQILSPESAYCGLKLSSKKKVLEKVSELMAAKVDVEAQEIFETILNREKLGSTGLGHGVAIPHGRLQDSKKAAAIFILLEEPVDYDSTDGQPVDVIFALLVPQDANTEQLKYLAQIAKLLSEEKLLSQIRHAHNDEALYSILEKGTLNIESSMI
jgi:PTS system nitrogen regulatory IIA component